MHSFIIQLETFPSTIREVTSMSPSDQEWFLNDIADCVDPVEGEDWERAISTFENAIGLPFDSRHIEDGTQCVTFRKEAEGCLYDRYTRFMEHVQAIQSLTFEDFKESWNPDLISMCDMYNGRFGIYVISEEFGIKTLPNFLRTVTPGDTYYYGYAYDYHW